MAHILLVFFCTLAPDAISVHLSPAAQVCLQNFPGGPEVLPSIMVQCFASRSVHVDAGMDAGLGVAGRRTAERTEVWTYIVCGPLWRATATPDDKPLKNPIIHLERCPLCEWAASGAALQAPCGQQRHGRIVTSRRNPFVHTARTERWSEEGGVDGREAPRGR